MKINREDVVQAALMLERWCKKNAKKKGECDCPFVADGYCWISGDTDAPCVWDLEYHLRTRGLNGKKNKPKEEFIPYTCKDCRQYPCAKHDEKPDYISRCDGFELW